MEERPPPDSQLQKFKQTDPERFDNGLDMREVENVQADKHISTIKVKEEIDMWNTEYKIEDSLISGVDCNDNLNDKDDMKDKDCYEHTDDLDDDEEEEVDEDSISDSDDEDKWIIQLEKQFVAWRKEHSCDLCLKGFNGHKDLTDHFYATKLGLIEESNIDRKRIEKKIIFPCLICGKIYPFNNELLLHMRSHNMHDESSTSLGKQEEGASSLAAKQNKSNSDNESDSELSVFKTFVKTMNLHACYECRKTFDTLDDLRRHLCKPKKARSYKKCGKEGKGHSCSMCHPRGQKNKPVHQCESCGKIFEHASALNSHMRIHTREKVITCEVCNKSFHDPYYLKQHMRVHSTGK